LREAVPEGGGEGAYDESSETLSEERYGVVEVFFWVEEEEREDGTGEEDEREGEEVEDGFEEKGFPDRLARVMRVELDHGVRAGGFVGGHRRGSGFVEDEV
jgi:hypothetical protein